MRTHEGQARSLNSEEFQLVMDYTLANSKSPVRDAALLAVSYYVGLRVKEIAELSLDDVLNNEGEIKQNVTLRKVTTKRAKGGFAYFTHPALREHLSKYLVEVRSQKSTDTKAVFVTKYTKQGYFPISRREELDYYEKNIKSKNRLQLGVINKKTNTLIGMVALYDINNHDGSCHITALLNVNDKNINSLNF